MEVRLFDKEVDQAQLDAFNIKIFDADSDRKKSEQAFYKNPYSNDRTVTAIAIHEGAIVGHFTSTPFALWVQGKEFSAHWGSGFHVLPDTRGMGVGKKLVACLTDSLPLLSGVVVVESSLRAFKSNGWVWPGLINDYVHIANPDTFLSVISIERIDRFLPTGTKLLANILLKTMRLPICWGIKMVHRLFGVPTEINKGATLGFEKVDEFGPEIDILWQKAKSHFELTHVRNAEYLNWQFPNERGWNKFINRTGNKRAVKTWGLYTIKRYADGGPLDGLMALNIIDVFWDFDEPNVVRELLQYILYLGHKQQVDIIMISGNFPELKTELRRSAFMKIPSTVYVGFSDPQLGESGIEEIYSHSYITRGYADAAGRLGP